MELNETRQSIIVATRNDDEDDDDDITDINNYGKLVKQSLMNNFNINDFIESTVPGSGSIETNSDNGGLVDIESTVIFVLFKCFVIGLIILAAIFGNMLVIVSVMQHRKLR